MLCAVLLAVWIGSKWYLVMWTWPHDRFGITLFNQGWFGCHYFDGFSQYTGGFSFGTTPVRELRWGFTQREYAISSGGTMWYAFAPLWLPLLISCVFTAWAWRVDRRLSRIGMCQKCGYDLTGLSDSACPECGVKA